MASGDVRSGPGAWPAFAGIWPDSSWLGGGFPSRPGPQTGWVCGGCGAGLHPSVRECPHCPPKDRDGCQPAREGGMCNCEEAG